MQKAQYNLKKNGEDENETGKLLQYLGPTVSQCDLKQFCLFIGFIAVIILNNHFSDLIPQITDFIPFLIKLIIAIPLIIGALIFANKALKLVYYKNTNSSSIIRIGPFRYSRHPMYFSAILISFGLLLFNLSILGLFYYGILCYFYLYLANFEENQLIIKYRIEYQDYRKNVSKWFGFTHLIKK